MLPLNVKSFLSFVSNFLTMNISNQRGKFFILEEHLMYNKTFKSTPDFYPLNARSNLSLGQPKVTPETVKYPVVYEFSPN